MSSVILVYGHVRIYATKGKNVQKFWCSVRMHMCATTRQIITILTAALSTHDDNHKTTTNATTTTTATTPTASAQPPQPQPQQPRTTILLPPVPTQTQASARVAVALEKNRKPTLFPQDCSRLLHTIPQSEAWNPTMCIAGFR